MPLLQVAENGDVMTPTTYRTPQATTLHTSESLETLPATSWPNCFAQNVILCNLNICDQLIY
jgi:hypothetical protein